jgi:alginate O-acetyltransferase complex protein AlgI
MLFNSFHFIFLFLPITLFIFFKIGGWGYRKIALAWLVGASLFFYGWWNPAYLGLLIGSILFNYFVGGILANHPANKKVRKKAILIFGVVVNLGLIGYYKYANFFIENANHLAGSNFFLEKIVLPLAISFFTFQQITYLVDTYYGETNEHNFLHYCIFVTFFPQLIAGPIVHHREMLPQFAKDSLYRFSHEHFSVGITIFSMGLFKKVILADGIAPWGNILFEGAADGTTITFFEAWGGALAYTFQLYFDFSGYSDMAIGLARMFGILLPLNFNSPYKATNITDFWRRWHMTLSRFFRDYLYIPLGGNRKGQGRTLFNLMAAMLLGGLWHGAGWTFIIWGGLHGIYLIINHIWREFKKFLGFEINTWWSRAVARMLTFVAVVIAWVFFRADSLDTALTVIKGMSGANGFFLRDSWLYKLGPFGNLLENWGVQFISPDFMDLLLHTNSITWSLSLLAIAWLLPNTQQIMAGYRPGFETDSGEIQGPKLRVLQWRPNIVGASISAVLSIYVLLNLSNVSEFLYFQF